MEYGNSMHLSSVRRRRRRPSSLFIDIITITHPSTSNISQLHHSSIHLSTYPSQKEAEEETIAIAIAAAVLTDLHFIII